MAERLKYKMRHHQTPGREHRQNTLSHQHHEYFLRSVSQSNRNKSKNKPMGPNQTEKLLHSKDSHKNKNKNKTKKKPKRQPMECEKIVANNATNKSSISKIYK